MNFDKKKFLGQQFRRNQFFLVFFWASYWNYISTQSR